MRGWWWFGKKKAKLLVRGQNVPIKSHNGSLTIIPRARMGSESKAHEAEGRMGY